MTENAFRILVGQRPYVDFGLVLPPGTFAIQALLMKAFEPTFAVQQIYTALIAFLSVIFLQFILSFLIERQLWRLLLAVPAAIMAPGIVYAFPSYDNDMGLIAIGATAVFVFAEKNESKPWILSLAALFGGMVFLFKQTGGLGFTFALLICVVALDFFSPNSVKFGRFKNFLIGVFAAILVGGIFVLLLSGSTGLQSMAEWIFVLAAKSRSGILGRVFYDFNQINVWLILLFWSLAWYLLSSSKNRDFYFALCLLSAPFIWTGLGTFTIPPNTVQDRLANLWTSSQLFCSIALAIPFVKNKKLSTNLVLVLLACAISLACFASQGARGSTMGLWPFFILMWGATLSFRFDGGSDRKLLLSILSISVPLSIAAAIYIHSNYRITSFVPVAGELSGSKIANLDGMKTPGEWLSNFDELIEWTKSNIPQSEAVASFPGEDPIYFVTGRIPQLKLFQMNEGTFPYPPVTAVEEARTNNIQWIIVKTNIQIPWAFFDMGKLIPEIEKNFELNHTLKSYKIYKRKI